MPNIEFIKPYEVKDGSGCKYAIGDVLECSAASSAHFVNRGVANYTDKKPGATAPRTSAERNESAQPAPSEAAGGGYGKKPKTHSSGNK